MNTRPFLILVACTLLLPSLATTASADPAVRLTIALRLPDDAALERFLAEVQDPASPSYHAFLTDDAFVERFAPTDGDVLEVAAWLVTSGLAVTDVTSDHLLVHAMAPREIALRALAPGASRPASVLAVLGLDDGPGLHPHHSALTRVTLGSTNAYSPNDTALAYDERPLYAANITGKGWSVAIATAYDVKASDVRAFDAQWGLSYHSLARTCVGGPCHFDANAGSDETTLDVEWAQATARGSTIRIVEGADASFATFTDVYDQIASNSSAKSVSTSWGACETQMPSGARAADEQIFMSAAAKGQSWFAASGDSGSSDCGGRLGVDYPASSPHVVGVGGTRLECAGWPACQGPGNETAWTGSGGGASKVFSAPAWQNATQRRVPDVALTSDPDRGNFVRFNGAWYVFGGTSEAAPQWAGLFALVDQQKQGGQGLPSARLYALGGTPAFHDITSGCNGVFCAKEGVDMVTGLGSFDAAQLVRNY